MLNKIILTCLFMMTPIMLRAETIDIKPDSPDRYVVQKGDTLWDISGRFLQQPWRWPEIWQANSQIVDPHLIYPGDVISLSYEGGSPVLTVERGEDAVRSSWREADNSRHVKLSPAVREYEHDEAIPSIPIDVIRHFLSRPMVVSEHDMDGWPYIVSSYEQHLIAGLGTRVYIRNLPAGSNVSSYSIYRQGPAYRSQIRYGGDILGYEALYVGELVVEKRGNPASAVITLAKREVLDGDRLIPQSKQEASSDFIPRPPNTLVEGSIISVFDGVAQIGQYQVVVLDVGESDGLEVGNILGIFQSGQLVNDKIKARKRGGFNNSALVEYLGKLKSVGEEVQLPKEFAAVVMVFRTFDKISYGLIMEAYGAIHLHDTVKNI